jgi:FkbM family methyltransferase
MHEQPPGRGSDAVRERVRRLVHRVAPDVEIEPPELGGLRLVVPRGYEGLYGEGYEPKVTAALRRLVQPGYVCADLGANVGFFALLMAQLAGHEGRVVAFEPREDMTGYLASNMGRADGRMRIEVRREAVTDGATDAIDLYSGGRGSEMRSTIVRGFAEREAPTGRRVISVPAVALDACFGPGDRLDLVKMDIEGGEAVVPLGARRVMAEQRPVFVVEFHRDVGWPAIAHFADAGYRFEKFDGTRIETPADPDAVPSYFVAVPS